jgi:hypothetical protein
MSASRYPLRSLWTLLLLLATGCGNNDYIVGTPVVTLTAKPGRFASYIVDLAGIQLTRQDGSVAGLLNTAQRVDLANLPSLYNSLEAPAVPVGTYDSATFTIDYRHAVIEVAGDGPSSPATLYDAGTKTTPTFGTIIVQFDPKHPLVVNSQQSSLVHFDIDLEESNLIGPGDASGTYKVTVKPFWTATTTPMYEKPVYGRGLFVFADSAKSQLVMNLRPLHDVYSSGNGALAVNVGDQTYYNIDGVTYVGATGLKRLAKLQTQVANLQIAALGPPGGNPFGALDTITPSFTATQIYAGSSLESTIEDQVSGVVAKVEANLLTVSRVAYVDRAGDFTYFDSLPITTGPSTIISTDGDANATNTLQSIPVGQPITVLGVPVADSSGNITGLDATSTLITGNQIRVQSPTASDNDPEQQLIIEWGTLNATLGSTAPFSAVSQDGLTIPLTAPDVGGSATIQTDPMTTLDLLGNGPGALSITFNTADSNHPPMFGVGSDAMGAYLDTDPAKFASHVKTVASGTEPIVKLVAFGHYDQATASFSASKVAINSQ